MPQMKQQHDLFGSMKFWGDIQRMEEGAYEGLEFNLNAVYQQSLASECENLEWCFRVLGM